MKIAIMSDTHDNVPFTEKAIEYFNANAFEYLFHAGDFVAPFTAKLLNDFKGKVFAVFGNNDGDKNHLRKVLSGIEVAPYTMTLGGRKIILVHDLLDVKDKDIEDADVVIYGHSHKSYIERRGDTLLINPGECSGWITGKHTVAVADIHERTAEIIDLNGKLK